MKITPAQWIEVVKLISTFIIGVISTLFVSSCTASMSILWKTNNSVQKVDQKTSSSADSTDIVLPFKN